MYLSIIVPIYNAEKFLDKCLSSVKNIKNIDFECLMIDDGSTDESYEICKRYVDKNFKYIFKENSGVSSTRNYGIEKSKGKYILFLDADDYLNENVEELLINAINSKSDFVVFDYKIDLYGKEVHKKYIKEKNDLLEDVIYKIYSTAELNTCWAKLFKSDVIKKNKLNFYQDIRIGEDQIFVMEYINCIESVKNIEGEILTYRINTSSAMNTYNPHCRFSDFEKSYFKIKNTRFAKESENILNEMNYNFFNSITHYFRQLSNMVGIGEYLKIYNSQVNSNLVKEIAQNLKDKKELKFIKRIELFLIQNKKRFGGLYFFFKGKLKTSL